ncbi:hypothetical protein Tco_1051535 [Tanacetum coccineum]
MNEEKYTPSKIKSNTEEDDVVLGSEMVRTCVSIKGKGSILFQGKNGEQKLLIDIYYILALRSNVISLGQATISDCDIRIRGDLLTMHDSCGSLLIKVPHSANRPLKTQIKVGKEDSNQASKERGSVTVLWDEILEAKSNQT